MNGTSRLGTEPDHRDRRLLVDRGVDTPALRAKIDAHAAYLNGLGKPSKEYEHQARL